MSRGLVSNQSTSESAAYRDAAEFVSRAGADFASFSFQTPAWLVPDGAVPDRRRAVATGVVHDQDPLRFGSVAQPPRGVPARGRRRRSH